MALLVSCSCFCPTILHCIFLEQGSSSTLRHEPLYFRSAPYNNVVRLQQFRASTVGSRRGGTKLPVARIWEGKVKCLGDPAEVQKPDQFRRRTLQDAKLGGPSWLSFGKLCKIYIMFRSEWHVLNTLTNFKISINQMTLS